MGRPRGHKLDATDVRLILELQKQPQMGYEELGKLVNLPYTPCRRRVKNLTDKGYIKFSVSIEKRKSLWKYSYCILVKLNNTAKNSLDFVAQQLVAIEGIDLCLELDGEWDFVVRLNLPEKDRFSEARAELNSIKGILRTQSSPIVTTVKEESISIKSLLGLLEIEESQNLKY